MRAQRSSDSEQHGGESINACWLFTGEEEAKNKKRDLAVERIDETAGHRKDNSPRENTPEGKLGSHTIPGSQ
jgi:hypothetical protein